MKENKVNSWLSIAVFILGIMCISFYSGQSEAAREAVTYEKAAETAEERVTELEVIIDEANDNITSVNSHNSNAHSQAWASYEEMGHALENLQEVDEIDY
jgi:hypothetical protein